MDLTISGYSTAMFATWYFVDEYGLLFDCGDGLMASLLHKSRKVEHVFISHADRDHLAGLLQFNQLNARQGFPVIHYPKDSGSFPALQQFSVSFDPHVNGSVWKPMADKEKVWIKKDTYVEAIRNNHVTAAPGLHKSQGYRVVQVKSKLKPEFTALPPAEIKKAIEEQGKEATHSTVETIMLSYSGDTPCENFNYWSQSKILIHEATFLGGEEDKNVQAHGNKHSRLEEVIEAVSDIQIEKLILGHFSSRYADEQIDNSILQLCKKYKIEIPVYRVLPGITVKNIMAQPPVYTPERL